jgi:hypothetical protein
MKKALTLSLTLVLACLAGCIADDDNPVRHDGATPAVAAPENPSPDNGEGPSEPPSEQDDRFSLNETAVFRNISVTAEEIIINDGWKDDEWSIFTPSEGNIFVAVKLNIENTSSEDQRMSTILLFDAYADGVKLEYSFGAGSGLEGTLEGNVSPGRRLVGYYGVEVSQNAQELELEVKSSWLSSGKAVFVFDIPKG